MPFVTCNDVRLHYEVAGPEDAPCLVLSNSLGTDLDLWAPQLPTFTQHLRVVRYDTRGHGASDVPAGPYTIEQLCGDVLGLLDHLQIARAHFCGISLGGLTGIALGARHASRIDRLVLCNTAAQIGSPETWNPRIEQARAQGVATLADAVMARWFTEGFRSRETGTVARLLATLAAANPEGYAASSEAVRDTDLRDEAATVTAPTLVIAGSHDSSTPAEQGHWLAEQIPGARFVELDAAHLSNVEQADVFTRAVVEFLLESA